MSVELPKDHEGREIPLDTEYLYMEDGTKQNVEVFMYSRRDAEWSVETHIAIYDTEELYLTPLAPHDSWEQLEEDLERAAKWDVITSCCRYFNVTNKCINCRIGEKSGCKGRKDERAFGNILDRIRKLRGEGE